MRRFVLLLLALLLALPAAAMADDSQFVEHEPFALDDAWVEGSTRPGEYHYYPFTVEQVGLVTVRAQLFCTGRVQLLDADLIREMGWNTRTLTEDLELTAQCGLRGEKIAYLEKAVTYDEQPVTFGVSFEQRRRWFRGSMQTTLRYWPKLIWRAIRHRSLQALDLAVFFLGNIMQFVCLVPGAVAAVETVRFAAGLGGVEVVAALAGAVSPAWAAVGQLNQRYFRATVSAL